MTVFVIDAATTQALDNLVRYATENPIGVEEMLARHARFKAGIFEDHPFKKHEVDMPFGFKVVFTIEEHPQQDGSTMWVRHMSMSSPKQGKVPLPVAIQMVMVRLGYVTPFESCMIWPEDIGPDHVAINVVEPMLIGETTTMAGGRA